MLILLLPWIIGLLVLSTIVFLVRKKWKVVIILFLVTLCLNWWTECIPFRLWSLSGKGSGRCTTVMSFNIDGSSGDIKKKAPRIVSLIDRYSPDVVFIAEYCEDCIPALDTLLAKTYPYSTLCKRVYFHYFYSKYPLVEEKRFRDSASQKSIDIYSCQVNLHGDKVALYGCHLPSNNYTAEMKCFSPDSIDTSGDMLHYIRNISHAFHLRAQQTELIVSDLKGANMPVIVMGDMNDVGGSASIKILEKCGLKDAWWEGGCGYGATIHKPMPYRIDHIFYSKGLVLRTIKVVGSEGLSDHDALYAEFEID